MQGENFVKFICKASNSVFEIFPKYKGPIYHYCPDAATEKIISNATLRFTDRRFQTDDDEAVFPLKIFKENVCTLIDSSCFCSSKTRSELINLLSAECDNRIKTPYSDDFYIFQSCYSIKDKSDPLWRTFSNENGFRLKFESETLINNLQLMNINENESQQVLQGQVIYEESEQVALMKKLVDKFIIFDNVSTCKALGGKIKSPIYYKKIIDRVMLLGTFMVKPCFKIENEFKIVLDLHKNSEDSDFSTIRNKPETFARLRDNVPFVDISFNPCALQEISIRDQSKLITQKRLIENWGKQCFSDALKNIPITVDKNI